MPSPFPGMDPYLEDPAFWRDFHESFITYWRDALNDLLPDHYEARIDERVSLVDVPNGAPRQVLPDVAVAQTFPLPTNVLAVATAVATEPVIVPLHVLEQAEEAYIQLLHRPDRTLVAVMELLSPSNKANPDRLEYLAKRNALLKQHVHLIELDLLVGGVRLPMRGALPPGHYYALVSRAERRFDCEVYARSVRQPLPTIRVPLKEPDPDLLLDLGAVFATTYERGRYARALPYGAPPSAPLADADRRWAEELARPKPGGESATAQ